MSSNTDINKENYKRYTITLKNINTFLYDILKDHYATNKLEKMNLTDYILRARSKIS